MKAAIHKDGCMCDECIKRRVLARRDKEAFDSASRGYISRRGAEIGEIDLVDALKMGRSSKPSGDV